MLFGTQTIKENELYIGGLSVRELVQKHGSPLYVYDVAHIEHMIHIFKEHFNSTMFNTRIAYASKAFLTKEMVRLISRHGLSLDLVSGGEIATALSVEYDMNQAIIHGNNKTVEELEMAVSNDSLIIVDSIYELEVLSMIAKEKNKKVRTLLRVNPGIEAHTHEYIITAKLTSKFGESIFDKERLKDIITMYKNDSFVALNGFHCHIGSQVFGEKPFAETIDVMSRFIKEVEDTYSISISTLNIGGGIGVYYTNEDTPVPLKTLLRSLIQQAETTFKTYQLSIDELIIEPGRSIISNAGTTLYEIGYKKETYGGLNYVFVNGGMTDNIRPALYQAKYSCDIATNMSDEKNGKWCVAGKLCESGDILIKETPLQPFQRGDILAIYTTGAYNYSMASNYNRMLKPEVIFVKDKQTKIVVKRETYEDILRNDL